MIGLRCLPFALNSNYAIASFKTSSMMPKNKGKNSDRCGPSAEVTQIEGPVIQNKNGSISLHIQAKPGAQQNAVTDISDSCIGVQIAAPPVDGEANTELIKYLSKVLCVRKSDLYLEKGSKSRMKTISVTSDSLNTEKIMEILTSETK